MYDISNIDDLIPFAKKILNGDYSPIVVLKGDLGAGKTTFVRQFVSLLEDDIIVSSPTFTLMNIYEASSYLVHHFDLYRLNSAEEAVEWGFDEFVRQGDFAFVEWAERAPELIPIPHTLITIKHGDNPNNRKLFIEEIIA